MSAPLVIEFLRPGAVNGADYEGYIADGVQEFLSERWDSARLGTFPDAQERADALADATVVNGQTFSQWYAEHDGDPAKTLRRKAREALNDNARESAAVDRAIVIELMTYCRHLAKQHNDLLEWLGTQTTLVSRPALNGFLAQRPTNAEARAAIDARIDAGEADT